MGEAKRRKEKDPTWGIRIREYTLNDFDDAIAIFDETNPVAHDFLSEEVLADQRKNAVDLLNNSANLAWVAEKDGKILGLVSMRNEHQIAGLYVSKDFQRKGLGKKLMEPVKDFSQKLELAVYEKNDRAVNFYKKKCDFLEAREGIDNGFKYLVMSWSKMRTVGNSGS